MHKGSRRRKGRLVWNICIFTYCSNQPLLFIIQLHRGVSFSTEFKMMNFILKALHCSTLCKDWTFFRQKKSLLVEFDSNYRIKFLYKSLKTLEKSGDLSVTEHCRQSRATHNLNHSPRTGSRCLYEWPQTQLLSLNPNKLQKYVLSVEWRIILKFSRGLQLHMFQTASLWAFSHQVCDGWTWIIDAL